MPDPFQIQKIAKVSREDARRFDEIHPEHGAWSWFVRECLSRYIALYDEDPVNHIDESVRSLRETHQVKVRHRNED